MHVLFDTSPAPFTPGGTRTYVEALAQQLPRAAAARAIRLTTAALPSWLQPNDTKRLQHKARVLGWDSVYMHGLLPLRARRVHADLLHTPAYRLPLWSSVPVVTTIHDVIPLVYPHFFRRRDRLMISAYFRLARRAAHLITDSEATRQDVHRLLRVPLANMTTVHLAASPAFRPQTPERIAAAQAQYNLTLPYVLSVATLEPRKNLERVLAAFAQIRHKLDQPHQLVLVGKTGWLYAPLLHSITALGLTEHVRLTGFVPEEDLPALYGGAAAFVYPSLYEGFGLPPLEAMATGCPVITSQRGSLHEVVGDAALVVDPEDTTAIGTALAEMLTDATLAERYRNAGRARAQAFSWEQTAAQTVAVYEHVMGQR